MAKDGNLAQARRLSKIVEINIEYFWGQVWANWVRTVMVART